ncbi:MAG: hypothetical protein C0193_00920 [Candidatus Bathyarchaeota archaeon]|nr:MAG: hypothetical protein C0193_00920 [Candidatus Bathyarchaeota archaeon]
MQNITRLLKKFGQARKGVSNVIVVMLSLILIVLIVSNVVLWSYQMNQFDLERIQESIKIANVTRVTRSSWFTAQKEYNIIAGSRLSGTYTETEFLDGSSETFREEFPSISYNPLEYILWNSTTFVSGSLDDLQANDGVCMQFRSYPSTFSDATETFGNMVAGGNYRNTENTIVGSLFTPAKDGEAQSITAYIRVTSQSKNMKCAIYLHSDLSLVAQTEEKNVPTGTAWVTFNFPTPKPILKANTEYLLVAWSSSGNGYAYLAYTSGTSNQGHYASSVYGANFPNPMPNPTHESRAYSIYCTFKPATEETVEVEFAGTANTESWINLTWAVNGYFTTDGVTAIAQLYNYLEGEYPTSGDGYMTNINSNQTITSNATYFRDVNGNWKIKIKGVKAASTQFELNVDWIEFKVTMSDIYRLCIRNDFTINLSTYPLTHIHGIEIFIRYNVTEAVEKWFLKAYNWTEQNFSNSGFNTTEGSQPAPNEWNEYAVNITENWRSYVKNDGTLLVEFFDEGLDANQTVVEIDFFAVRAIIDGAGFDLRNNGPITTHIVSIWIINATHHQRYNANWFINAGEEATYIRADISLPEEFIAKVVTEKGNIAVFTQS